MVSIFIFPLASFWPGPSLVLISDFFIVLVVSESLIAKRFSYSMKWVIILMALSLLQIFFLTVTVNFDIVYFLQGRPIFVYLLIIFFYMHMLLSLDRYNLIMMYQFIELCIKILIASIIVDGLAINFFDMQKIFINVFQSSIGNYRDFKNPGILFPKIPNGLIFGAQHASILSVVGITWWLPGIKGINAKYLSQYLWLILSIIALVFSLTVTSVIVLAIMLAVTLFIMLFRKRKIIESTLIVMVILAAGIITEFKLGFLFLKNTMSYRHNQLSESLAELKIDRYYHYAVEQPINDISKHFSELLIGVGRVSDYQLLDVVGEIGFISIVTHYGLVLVGVLMLSYLFYILKGFYFIIRNNVNNEEYDIIHRLLMITIVIMSSMMHYTTLSAPGIKQLFAAIIALSFVLLKKNSSRKNHIISVSKNSCTYDPVYAKRLHA